MILNLFTVRIVDVIVEFRVSWCDPPTLMDRSTQHANGAAIKTALSYLVEIYYAFHVFTVVF